MSWIEEEADNIPKEYDEMLKESYATDLFAYANVYSLSLAEESGNLLPP